MATLLHRVDFKGSADNAEIINKTLDFAQRCNGNWHDFAKESSTLYAIRWLAGRGLIQVNGFNQFRAVNRDGTPRK